MSDTIVLLEEKKEITTFLLDEGTITSTDVVLATGTGTGYEYSNKIYTEDIVCISPKSEIGRERVKKYTGSDVDIPIGIVVNDPIVMSNGERKASILLLGGLYRLKLASGLSNIKTGDRIKTGAEGAVVDNAGEFLALHPVSDSDEYNYINCFQISAGIGKGQKGDTGEPGTATTILGSFDSLEELVNAYPNPKPGDAFIVNGYLFVWNE